jgi:prepilin-type N-terminal cleavage/methylation domain-containing protein
VKQFKNAFTLFELMIVVMIIGIVYALVLGRMDPKQHLKIVKLDSLRDTMLQHHKEGQKLDLVLYDNCKKSAFFLNNSYQEDIKINLKPELFQDLTVYKSDPFGHERKISFSPVIIEDHIEPVCFQYTIYPNGSGSHYIIKQQNLYYVFPPYFEDINITESLDEALALYTHEKEKKITFHE